jgi:hypothetical protein
MSLLLFACTTAYQRSIQSPTLPLWIAAWHLSLLYATLQAPYQTMNEPMPLRSSHSHCPGIAVQLAQVASNDLLRGLDGISRTDRTSTPLGGSRQSQLPAASLSLTPSSAVHSAGASDCPSCPAVLPPSPTFAARPLQPQTKSTLTRAPPPVRFVCCTMTNSLK